MIPGYRWKEAECGVAAYTDDELQEAFDNLLTHGKKSASYKFIFLLALLKELDAVDMNLHMQFDLAFRGFAGVYWETLRQYADSKYFQATDECAAQIVRDAMAIFGSIVSFGELPKSVQENVSRDMGHECDKNVIGAACADLLRRVYGFSKQEKQLWFNPSAYEFMKREKVRLQEQVSGALQEFVEKREG